MAKFQSTLIEQASGKLGENIVMRQTATGKILCKAPKKATTPRRSEKQAYTRLQMANLLANYRLYSGKLAEAFESKRAGLSDVNMFVSANWGHGPVYLTRPNWGHGPVYLTRPMRIQGACVLADDLFSIGSIEPIGYGLNGAGRLVTNLNLGIEIGAGTTVAQFSGALMTATENWREGDQLTFFVGTQYTGTDGLPRANMRAQKVVLSLDDQTKLWDVVTSEGFSTVDGYLATGMVLSEMGCAWVHSRENSGNTKVSTQRLVVVSEVLPQYQTYAAMKAAADSYGGINKSAVYLNPQSSLNETLGGGGTGGNTGGGSNTNDTNGTNSGGGSNTNDTNSGGGSNTEGTDGENGGTTENGGGCPRTLI